MQLPNKDLPQVNILIELVYSFFINIMETRAIKIKLTPIIAKAHVVYKEFFGKDFTPSGGRCIQTSISPLIPFAFPHNSPHAFQRPILISVNILRI